MAERSRIKSLCKWYQRINRKDNAWTANTRNNNTNLHPFQSSKTNNFRMDIKDIIWITSKHVSSDPTISRIFKTKRKNSRHQHGTSLTTFTIMIRDLWTKKTILKSRAVRIKSVISPQNKLRLTITIILWGSSELTHFWMLTIMLSNRKRPRTNQKPGNSLDKWRMKREMSKISRFPLLHFLNIKIKAFRLYLRMIHCRISNWMKRENKELENTGMLGKCSKNNKTATINLIGGIKRQNSSLWTISCPTPWKLVLTRSTCLSIWTESIRLTTKFWASFESFN